MATIIYHAAGKVCKEEKEQLYLLSFLWCYKDKRHGDLYHNVRFSQL